MYWYNLRDGRKTFDISRSGLEGEDMDFIDLVQYRDSW
jgi:hypothetical protein